MANSEADALFNWAFGFPVSRGTQIDLATVSAQRAANTARQGAVFAGMTNDQWARLRRRDDTAIVYAERAVFWPLELWRFSA